MPRDPHYTSVCKVCSARTWYSPEAIEVTPAETRRGGRPAFVTDPRGWEMGQRSHEHGTPGARNLQPIDRSMLVPRFARYLESGERIRVAFITADGSRIYETRTGTVSMSGGWRPVYLLMLTARSVGSMYVLRETDIVLDVKVRNEYHRVSFADPRITAWDRLAAIRKSITAESVSMGELAELQGLVPYIDPFDVQLLEWAGVPEFPEEAEA